MSEITPIERPHPSPPRRRRWLRWTLGALGSLVLLVVLAPLAVGCGPVRSRVEEAASQAAGTPVRIGSLSAWWSRGLVLEDLVVESPPGHDGPLARVERIEVDVALRALWRGRVEAEVRVTRPLLMLRRGADGSWNTRLLAVRARPQPGAGAGAGRAGQQDPPREPAPAENPPRADAGTAPEPLPRLSLRLQGGVVEAHGVGPAVQRMRDIDLEAEVHPDGLLSTGLSLLAEQAGVGGVDAPIRLSATRKPGARAPLSASVPALDLARLAGLVEGLTGLRDLAGTTSLEARGELGADGSLTATLELRGASLTARSPSGQRLALRRLQGALRVVQGPGRDRLAGDLALESLEVLGEGGGAALVSEPSVRLRFDLEHEAQGAITFAALDVALGEALRLQGSEGLRIARGEGLQATVEGSLSVRTDLGRLCALLGTPPGPDAPRGTLEAHLQGKGRSGDARVEATLSARDLSAPTPGGARLSIDSVEGTCRLEDGAQGRSLDTALRLSGVALRGTGRDGPRGPLDWREPAMALEVACQHDPSGLLTVSRASLSAGAGLAVGIDGPLRLRLQQGELRSLEGRATLEADLARLAPLASQLAGIEGLTGRLRGEVAGRRDATGQLGLQATLRGSTLAGRDAGGALASTGSLEVALEASRSGERPRADVRLDLRDLALRAGPHPGDLRLDEPRLSARMDLVQRADGSPELALRELSCSLLRMTASEPLRVSRATDGTLAVDGPLELRADLAPWSRALALPPASRLEGTLAFQGRVQGPAHARRVEGRLVAEGFAWQASPATPRIEEPRLELEHALVLGAPDGSLSVERLRLSSRSLSLDLQGSRGEAGSLALRGSLAGDAALLAPRLRTLGGDGFHDLEGEGPLSGTLEARAQAGSGPLAERLQVQARLDLGTWASSGARAQQVRLQADRPAVDGPQSLRLSARLNGGEAQSTLQVSPAAGRLPWTLEARLQGVDTSTFVMRNPLVKRLALVLPTLVPLEAATPALSGLLDASVSLEAPGLDESALPAALSGRGEVLLARGTLGQSTLFGSLAGGKGALGDVGQALLRLAPEVSKALARTATAVTYREVTSRFRVAGQMLVIEAARLVGADHRLEMEGQVQAEAVADLRARLVLEGKAGEEARRVLPQGALPLRIRGSLSRPQVRPDLKASDLLQALGPSLEDLLKDPKKALRDLLPR